MIASLISSPCPWALQGRVIVDAKGKVIIQIGKNMLDRGNAELIVKGVNQHELSAEAELSEPAPTGDVACPPLAAQDVEPQGGA